MTLQQAEQFSSTNEYKLDAAADINFFHKDLFTVYNYHYANPVKFELNG